MSHGTEPPTATKTTADVIEPVGLRSCFGRLATGVTVVSYRHDGEPRGATVNAFSSVSLDPALVVVSIARPAKACPLLQDRPFVVNVLFTRQIGVAMTSAGRPDTTAVIEWDSGRRAPRLRPPTPPSSALRGTPPTAATMCST